MKNKYGEPVKSIAIFNKQAFALALAAFAINLVFLHFNKKNIFVDGLLKSHGEVAYNLYKYNSIKVNYARMGPLAQLEQQTGKRGDYYEIDHESFGPGQNYRNHFDTIGYGVLIGLLWKLTHTLDYFDIQLLQVLLFSLLMFLVYAIAFMLFASKRTALFSCIALLAFFPIHYLNVQVFRDIYPYYASIILLFTAIRFLFHRGSWGLLTFGSISFGLLQWMRPTLFLTLCLSLIVLLGYAFFSSNLKLKRSFVFAGSMLLGNLIFFWIPFATYNKIAYDQYLVGPAGINLIQGLGEFPNKWGYQLSDGWYGNYSRKHFGEQADQLQLDDNQRGVFFDAKMKNLFWKSAWQDPWFYLTTLRKRVVRLIFPGLPWFNYQDTKELYLMYLTGTPLKEIIKIIFREPLIAFDFFARHIYIGFFLLFAYLGILLAIFRKKYLVVLLLFVCIIGSSYSVVFAHVDHRYLIPFYGIFPFFVGYLFSELISELTKRKV